MPRFLIEVPHEAQKDACTRAVNAFLKSGSHFMTNADWGCSDNEHSAWIIIEVDDKNEARNAIPQEFRADAKIVALEKFTLDPNKGPLAAHS